MDAPLARFINPKAFNGPDKIPGTNPAKCPTLLATDSYSLSGCSPTLRVVNPSKKPAPACCNACNIENSPS